MSKSIQRTFILLIVLATASFAFAQDRTEGPAQILRVDAQQITWQPNAGAGWVVVTVTGPGEYAFTAEFPPGQLPIFQALDPDGNPLPDGTYNYEIGARPANPKVRAANDPQGLPTKSPGKGPVFATEAGTFTVLNGSIVNPNVQEQQSNSKSSVVNTNATVPDSGVRPLDQVILDDLIVDGSACIGQDCVNGESFGFDTLRLKENNLRIKFDDTSNSGSFPNNDWQLTANDSANGGANRFSIEDTTNSKVPFTIEANAPSNTLYVDSSSNVGFGTSTPVVELHSKDGDTPTLRLEQDGSSGFTPQTWDVAGNETNFFVRDVSNGSSLPFKIRPGAASNSLVIDVDDDIGMGILSPGAPLHLKRTDHTARILVEDASGSTSNQDMLEIRNNGNVRFRMTNTSGEGSSWYQVCCSAGWLVAQEGAGNRLLVAPNGKVTVPGDLEVGGTLTKSSGSFKIDHPLDPANKYLYHSFVESPDMMNIYNGNVTLDDQGEATVRMPDWFAALNRDFRYQLTAIGAPSPGLYIADEISNTVFRIAGGSPETKVSWQVTGVRQDPFAVAHRIPVEENKALADRGTFLFPGYEDSALANTPATPESSPEQIITAKNAEIRNLRGENEVLRQRLTLIDQRLRSIEAMISDQNSIRETASGH